MTDSRYQKLAELLVGYSTSVKKGENVQLHMIDVPDEFTVELIRSVRKRKATPYVQLSHGRVMREILRGTDAAHAQLSKDIELGKMKKFQSYIAIRGAITPTRRRTSPATRWRSTPRRSARSSITASTRQNGSCYGGRRRAWLRPPT